MSLFALRKEKLGKNLRNEEKVLIVFKCTYCSFTDLTIFYSDSCV